MAGGAYNYLCFHGDSLSGHRAELERMARRLEGLSWAGPAAAATRECVRILADLDRLTHALSETWQAIEWWDSANWGEQAARRVVVDFEHPGGTAAEEVLYRLVDVGGRAYELRPIRQE